MFSLIFVLYLELHYVYFSIQNSKIKIQNCPIVADVHFQSDVADAAAKVVEKVRINPGNYIDPARKFKQIDYTEEEYQTELERLRNRFVQLLNICKAHKTALRIGVNHGSLSDRIMSRYGDTPEGMVESCMEFLRVAVAEDFKDIVLSIKASNTRVMVTTVRLLVWQMQEEGMAFPLHLGVTEAGEGEDGRVKSAVGIGALLADGIGDTIRVSLSEAPEKEEGQESGHECRCDEDDRRLHRPAVHRNAGNAECHLHQRGAAENERPAQQDQEAQGHEMIVPSIQ